MTENPRKNIIDSIRVELDKLFEEVNQGNFNLEGQKEIVERIEPQFINNQLELLDVLIGIINIYAKKFRFFNDSELVEIYQEWYQLRNTAELMRRKVQLLQPRDLEDFRGTLMWMSEHGNEEELELIKKIRNKLPFDTEEIKILYKRCQQKIEDRIFSNQPSLQEQNIYQIFCSESELKEIFPDIEIIESYDAFIFISIDNEEIISQVRTKYPVKQLEFQSSEDPGEDSGEPTMVKKEQIVKFRFPVRREWKQRIEGTGANILQPLGNSEFIVSIPNQETLDQIKQFREVDSVIPYEPTIRVQENYLESLGAEITDEMLAEAKLKIGEKTEIDNNIIPGILIARFFTEEDQNNALKTLENEKIDVVDQPDINEIIVDLINHSNPLNAYQIIKNLPGLISLEEENIETTYNHIAVSLLAKGTSPTNHISGLTGNGEIIAIADTGLDLQIGENTVLHPDFDGRIKKIKSYPIKPSYSSSRVHNPHGDDGASDKYSGHGTHVAGSALGNGTMAQNYGLPPIQGMAPEAELIFQAIEQTPQWTEQEIIKSVVNLRKIPPASNLSGIPSNLKVLFEFAYNNGARIHSNSWGGSGSDRCRQVDTFVWENKNFLIVFAAGNEGNQKRTITPPGTSKNCITVGASDEFSSRGPCEDGRLKPDVIAPGAYILSTRSCQITHHSEAPYPPVKDFYMYTSGTSMATPLVAGSAALVREYFRTRKRIDDPSAALVKAALIHSADYKRETSSQKWADDKQGWGMINLSRIIDRPAPYAIEFFDRSQGFSDSGEQHNYQFEITNDSIPLRVTLVYTDYPDEKLIGKLVNNLNLEVYNPKDKYYCGNDFDDEGKKDYLNNVEGCIINTPIEGKWKIRIVGETIAQPPQDYALIVSGAFINWQFNL